MSETAEQESKKPYVTPELIIHGSVQELTQGHGHLGQDAHPNPANPGTH
jgi:hypothetical protein